MQDKDVTVSPLLERAALVEVLDAAIRCAENGAGRLLIVEGGPGLGKSTLVEVARLHAADRGLQLLGAAGRPLEHEFPFGVALQLFEPAVGLATTDDALFAGAAALARPLVAGDTPRDALPGTDDSFALLHGLYWLTANLADRGPLLMTVDDAHWADRASLRFLLYLADRIADLPVVLAIATWPVGGEHASDVLAHLRAKRTARLLDVEPLSARAVADLTRSRFFPEAADEFCAAVHDATGGNPFFTIEYLKALDADGIAPTAVRVAAMSPPSIKLAAVSRLAATPLDATRLASALAVVGDDADPECAIDISGLRPLAAVAAVETLRAADLVATSDPLRFTHPLVRAAVYDSLSATHRDELHRRAARSLVARGAPGEQVAVHFLPTAPAGDDLVVATLWAAATNATGAGEPHSAVKLLRRALAEPPLADVRDELLIDLGVAEGAASDPGGLRRLEVVIGCLRSRRRRAEVYAQIGTTLRIYGRSDDAARAFSAGLAIASDAPSELVLRLETGYLAATVLARSLNADPARLSTVLDNSQLGTTTRSGRAALAHLAFARATAGESAAVVSALATTVLDASTDPNEWVDLLPAASVLAWAENFERADELATAVIDAASARGEIMTVGTGSFRRAESRYHEGRLVEALADGQQALAAEQFGWQLFLAEARAIVALCHLDRNESRRAALLLGGARAEVGTEPAGLHAYALGRLHLALNDSSSAAEMFAQAGDVLAHSRTCSAALIPWRSGAALALNQLGDQRSARHLAAEEVDVARSFGAPGQIAAALCVAGLLAERESSPGLLEEAVELARSSKALLTRCRVLVEAGAAARRAGRRTHSVRLLREGSDLAERCGALVVMARADEELSAAGTGSRRRPLIGIGALTPGELRVSTMAASGLTNREIAQRLFVTDKAVEWHLRNSFVKLDVSSRRKLASALGETAGAVPTASAS